MLTSLILSACGSDEESTKAEEDVNVDASEETTEEVEKTKEEVVETTSAANASGDISDLIKYMEEETEGTAKVLYENTEPQVHKMEGVTVSLDNYTLVELKDFHTDFSIPFNDQTNGGVIVAQYTVKNELDKDMYYTPFFYLSFTGAQKAYNNYRDLLPLEDQLSEKLSPSNDYLLKAGESVTGYYTYPFGQDDLQAALNVSTTAVEVPAALAVKDDFGSAIGKKGQFTLSLNTAGADKVKSNEAFYKDKATVADMGEKKMLKEQSGIGKSEALGDVTVTLDGYQFTEFTPNEVEAPRFESFKTGIVLLTVKFNLDNKGADAIGLSSISSKLTVNDGTQYMLGEGMLLNYSYDDLIAAGESGELLQIYTLDKEQYEKIWKNKSFEVEVGPIRNQDAKDISKGKTAVFSF
ncbi:DUF5068 domain-containing protein [Ureibacillus sp. GCM10028918]|uniref:DUF5068 domain-containing protein n=1 Tax=Ureibacillus sp. GCM10028918 TaxID=3273429 RepID=UPI0036205D40